jgi:hypothetical protein
MNEESMPGTSSADQDLERRWRAQSDEEPSSLTDARIRAAARQATTGREPSGAARRSSRWTRFVPFAAAASVALLAVGLVRLIPQEEYEVRPRPEATRHDAPREAESAPPARPVTSPEESERSSTHYLSPSPTTARSDVGPRDAESMLSQERQRPAESRRTESLDEQPHQADEVRAEADARETADQNVVSTTAARPVETFATSPSSKASAPAAGEATAAISAGVRRSSPDALKHTMPDALAEQVRADAARRMRVDPASIRIVAVEPTAWPDRSLGCNRQREDAQETLVPGYLVTVEGLGTTLRYHTDDRDRIVVCESE